jgi:hypothetical protein
MTGIYFNLYDLALLINYERTSLEPRFRGAKLREVMHNGAKPKGILLLPKDEWFQSKTPNKVGWVFEKEVHDQSDDERDTPDEMLTTLQPPPSLTPKECEMIFYQARAHDACFGVVYIMQELFDLLPEETCVRVRTQSGCQDFYAAGEDRCIYEGWLRNPKLMTYSTVMTRPTSEGPAPCGQARATARKAKAYVVGEGQRLIHAVLAFYDPNKRDKIDFNKPDVILDMSSIQFGDEGRGLKGKSLFVLESFEEYSARMLKVSDGMDPETVKVSLQTGPPVDRGVAEYMKDVAKRVKERLDKRDKEHWCGHCGAPAKQRCEKCKKGYFCNREHFVAAWPMHKQVCR